MRRYYIDAGLIALLSLLAIAGVVHSATGGEQFSVVLLAIVLSAAAIIVSCLLVGYRRYTKRPVLPGLIAPVACLAMMISVAVTYWPLRVTYALSRDAFDSIAERVRAGEPIAMPVRAGLFTVRTAELSHQGIVCLWTVPDPAGSTGFVQCRHDYVPFNLWSLIRLDDRWQFIAED
jgi:hypothetical protein